ncbi:MAG: hypothetical protein DWQ40_02865 [Actinobacteria bacterium]|nr:MAG: hypothetical protein DWQ40_02865 [Actinomycetota bacterium]REK40552.1 MAG: hypothetical protein DWQ20_01685 [Actinomycetota bacterium]
MSSKRTNPNFESLYSNLANTWWQHQVLRDRRPEYRALVESWESVERARDAMHGWWTGRSSEIR